MRRGEGRRGEGRGGEGEKGRGEGRGGDGWRGIGEQVIKHAIVMCPCAQHSLLVAVLLHHLGLASEAKAEVVSQRASRGHKGILKS